MSAAAGARGGAAPAARAACAGLDARHRPKLLETLKRSLDDEPELQLCALLAVSALRRTLRPTSGAWRPPHPPPPPSGDARRPGVAAPRDQLWASERPRLRASTQPLARAALRAAAAPPRRRRRRRRAPHAPVAAGTSLSGTAALLSELRQRLLGPALRGRRERSSWLVGHPATRTLAGAPRIRRACLVPGWRPARAGRRATGRRGGRARRLRCGRPPLGRARRRLAPPRRPERRRRLRDGRAAAYDDSPCVLCDGALRAHPALAVRRVRRRRAPHRRMPLGLRAALPDARPAR